MSILLFLVAVTALATFVACTAFPLVFTLKPLYAGDQWMPLSVRVIGWIWGLAGVPADVIYNLVMGTIKFRELPRELLFTTRVQRHVEGSIGWRLERALLWAGFLNAIDPGHIKVRQ